MSRLLAPATLFAALAVSIALVSAAPAAHADETGDHPSCIVVSGTARYGAYGYDHIVTVRNGCERDAVCSVTTNVNAQAARLNVAASASADVVMWRGSPAREFAPRADCTLSGAARSAPSEVRTSDASPAPRAE